MSKPIATNVVPSFTGKMPKMGLKRFLDEYLKDFNCRQAAFRTGRTARWSESHGLTAIKAYSEYLDWKQKIHAVENAQKVSMDQETILVKMEQIANANIQDYFTWREIEFKEGKKTIKKKVRAWKGPEELTRDQAAAVKRVVMARDGTIEDYILYDKDSNLVSLGRHIGMFSEKVILEHRHKHLHMKADFSKMPIERLLLLEQEFLPYLPESMKEAR